MGKHTDALKPLDEFRAPWETADGTEAEIDKPKLRRFIFNLMSDKAKAQDARDETAEAVAEAEKERDEAKAEAEKASPDEANKKIAKLEAENKTLKDAADARAKADEHEELRKEVIGDLDPKYAKYVTGADREALEKSLESVKEDFDLSDEPGDDEDEDAEVRTRPRSRLKNSGDPETGKPGSEEVDYDKAADQIIGSSIFG